MADRTSAPAGTDRAATPATDLGPLGESTVLSVENVWYSYTAKATALRNLNLSLRRHEVLSIIGPSGCGKSTLLAAIAGLLKPDAGRIRWAPDIEASPDGTRGGTRLTIMFQKETLLPWLNVEQNVGVGLKYVKWMDKQAKKEHVNRLLEMGGLTDARQVYPRHLSGGMKRRVALLASVAPLPRVLMLDEPFAALDEPTRVGIHEEVLNICHEMKVSVILVTHDLAEAISLGDRVGILSGRPASVVSTHNVRFTQTRNMFTLRQSDEFQDLYKLLWGELSEQIAKA